MRTASQNTRSYWKVLWVAIVAVPAYAAQPLAPAQQTALVHKYCAVCHTDAVQNGGLSLEHYDAAQGDPALAAMLLSKLRSGAMGAAGLGLPEPAIRDAWVAATAAQAQQAGTWTVVRTGAPDGQLAASIVRTVAPREKGAVSPLYRLTLACDHASQKGEIQLAWSPAPQTDRTFFVSVDGSAGVPHKLEGREEHMGNGVDTKTGLAAILLNVPLPQQSLTVTDLFPGESVPFPMNELDAADRRQLAVCLSAVTRK